MVPGTVNFYPSSIRLRILTTTSSASPSSSMTVSAYFS